MTELQLAKTLPEENPLPPRQASGASGPRPMYPIPVPDLLSLRYSAPENSNATIIRTETSESCQLLRFHSDRTYTVGRRSRKTTADAGPESPTIDYYIKEEDDDPEKALESLFSLKPIKTASYIAELGTIVKRIDVQITSLQTAGVQVEGCDIAHGVGVLLPDSTTITVTDQTDFPSHMFVTQYTSPFDGPPVIHGDQEAVSIFFSQLGFGSMGAVFKAQLGQGNKVIAVKVVSGKAAKRGLQREVSIIKEINDTGRSTPHPHILQTARYIEGQDAYMLTECVGNLTFQTYWALTQPGVLPEQQLKDLFAQVVSAGYHLHKLGYVHRDIKPGNIVVSTCGTRATVIDFADTVKLSEGVSIKPLVTTPGYLALEILNGDLSGFAADVWGAAASLLYLCLGPKSLFLMDANSLVDDFRNQFDYVAAVDSAHPNERLMDRLAAMAEARRIAIASTTLHLLAPHGKDVFKRGKTQTVTVTAANFTKQLSAYTEKWRRSMRKLLLELNISRIGMELILSCLIQSPGARTDFANASQDTWFADSAAMLKLINDGFGPSSADRSPAGKLRPVQSLYTPSKPPVVSASLKGPELGLSANPSGSPSRTGQPIASSMVPTSPQKRKLPVTEAQNKETELVEVDTQGSPTKRRTRAGTKRLAEAKKNIAK